MSAKGPVLVTGLNGYLGQWAAEAVLKAGYPVRGTVRRAEAGEQVKCALVQRGYDQKLIEVAVVADMIKPGAFDDAVKGCYAVIHQASPTMDVFSVPPKELSRIAVDSTNNIVDSALTHAGPQLQSIVLMSSNGAVMDYPYTPRVYTDKDTAVNMIRAVEDEAEWDKIDPNTRIPFVSYMASKANAERAFWARREALHAQSKDDKPRVAFTAVQATSFIGPGIIPWLTTKDFPMTTYAITGVLMGADPATSGMGPGGVSSPGSIDVRDVARVLMWSAMNPEKADGERILLNGRTGGSQAVADLLDRWGSVAGGQDGGLDIPAELKGFQVKNKGTPGKGYKPDYSIITDGSIIEFDGSRVPALTGQDYIRYEQSVLDTVMAALPAAKAENKI